VGLGRIGMLIVFGLFSWAVGSTALASRHNDDSGFDSNNENEAADPRTEGAAVEEMFLENERTNNLSNNSLISLCERYRLRAPRGGENKKTRSCPISSKNERRQFH
jgi:hypothetical protein